MDKAPFFGGMFTFPFVWGIIKLVLTGNPAYVAYLVACYMVLGLVKTNDESAVADQTLGEEQATEAEDLTTGDSGPEEIAPGDDAILEGGGTSTPVADPNTVQPDITPTPVKMGTPSGAIIPSREEAGGRQSGDTRRRPHQPKGNLTIVFGDGRLPEDSPFFVKNKNFFMGQCMQDIQKEKESPIRHSSEESDPPSLPDDSPFFVKNVNFKGNRLDVRENVPERLESIEIEQGPSREPVVPFENFGARGGTGLGRRGVKFLQRVREICCCCCCCK